MFVSRLTKSPVGGRVIIGLCTSGLLLLVGNVAAAGTPGAPGVGSTDPALRQLANETLGLRDSRVIRVDPDLSPAVRFETTIELYDVTYTLRLKPYSARSDDYRVYHSDAEGNLVEVEPGPVTTMRGRVNEDPDSLVAAGITEDGLFARIMLSDGRQFWVEPLGSLLEEGAGLHLVYENEDIIDPGGVCGTQALGAEAMEFDPVIEPASGGCEEGESVYQADVACDADKFYFDRWGGGTEARINLILSTMDIQYRRDVDIVHLISTIIIRTDRVYSTTSNAEGLLIEFRNRWNANHGGVNRDVAHLFTNRFLASGIIGIAYTGVVCNRTSAYGLVRSDFNNVFACATDLSAHELAHNWSAPHCNCNGWTMNPFITCANRFISSTQSIIESFRDSRTCIVNGPLPPENDDCADAIAIGDGSHGFTTEGSSDDGGGLPDSCNEGGGTTFRRDVWFVYTATCTGTATASVCDADYNSKLAAYDTCYGDVIGCSDDFCGESGTRSEATFDVTEGEEYIIRIGGRTQTGCGNLVMSCVEGVPCPEDVNGDQTVDFDDVLLILAAWGPCEDCDEDINDDMVVDFSDVLLALSAWGDC